MNDEPKPKDFEPEPVTPEEAQAIARQWAEQSEVASMAITEVFGIQPGDPRYAEYEKKLNEIEEAAIPEIEPPSGK